jgi:two-component system OmpR family response regulator
MLAHAMKVLVVEDDKKLAGLLSRALAEEGYEVEVTGEAASVVDRAAAGRFGLVVLDWMLPDVDGVTVCRRMREARVGTPVLMLTARGDVKDRVAGLDAGADDYLVKPFEIDELLARVRALGRRGTTGTKLTCGNLEVDRVARQVRIGGAVLSLTAREYGILVYLMENEGRAVSRAELLQNVWETAHDPGTNVVEVHVSRLREKLGAHAATIETVRGQGYRLIAP